ncbi:hypothetical protein ACUUL3_10050 [Thiovibrio sp. JS02]
MDELLQEIKMLPGVKGVFVYIGKPDLTFSDLPPDFSHETVKQMEASIERIFKMNASCRLSVNSVEMLFDDTMVLAKHLHTDSSLVVLCEPDANFPLINMTSNMLIGELAQGVEKVRANPEAAQKSVSAKKPGGKSFAEAQKEEPLKSAIPVFQDALARAIGPIAAMIVRETMEKWLQAGDCKKERFPELVTAFCKEIGDPALEKEFKAQTARLL